MHAMTRRNVLTAAAVAGAEMALGPLMSGCSSPPNANSSAAVTDIPAGVGGRASGMVTVSLAVNGKVHNLQLEPRVTLLDALREDTGLTGTKKGCDHGQCGACTVLIDGRRSLSCLTLAVAVQGKNITTIEGLATGDQLHPVQAAFIEHDAFQCGYCTPGQICSAVGLMNEGHAKTDDDIRGQMAGNICRCGAYPNIVAAVRLAMTVA
jgi:xanthine dehydrogenase YagT iron-sulfur-binding subunit